MKIMSVVGARPNFMKIAPFIHALNAYNASRAAQAPCLEHLLVHTGQHYDDKLSHAFFAALDIPPADINLGIGSGSHAEQVGRTMIEFEKVIRTHRPDWVVVVGDVNATCACSITAKKEHIRLAHIEAGLRSGDMDMPEEVNRLVTDRLSDLLFTPDRLSGANLRAEGVAEDRIKFVGNIMIDTLEAQRARAEALRLDDVLARNLLSPGDAPRVAGVREGQLAVMTLHRPSNVDHPEIMAPLVDFLLDEVAGSLTVAWPIHPRAKKQLEAFGLWPKIAAAKNMMILNPVDYHDMLKLTLSARVMLTDSGGLQEECCVAGTPCLTLRWNTERPVTLKDHGGVSVLVGNDVGRIRTAYRAALAEPRRSTRPELWDGRTAQRIVGVFAG